MVELFCLSDLIAIAVIARARFGRRRLRRFALAIAAFVGTSCGRLNRERRQQSQN
jgi:hypothetical protein